MPCSPPSPRRSRARSDAMPPRRGFIPGIATEPTMLSSIIVPSHALLAAVLLAAVVTDVRSRRIPNKLVLCGIAVALVVHAIAMSTGAPSPAGRIWWAPLAGMATGFALLLPLHLVHAMGAG